MIALGARVQGLDPRKFPLALPVAVKPTVPAGVVGEGPISVTVAVQTETWPTTITASQETVVVVTPVPAEVTCITAGLVVELAACEVSDGE